MFQESCPFSAYTILGQDDRLRKSNLKILWNHRVGKYGSNMTPHFFPQKS